jgi:hypothetical protein
MIKKNTEKLVVIKAIGLNNKGKIHSFYEWIFSIFKKMLLRTKTEHFVKALS